MSPKPVLANPEETDYDETSSSGASSSAEDEDDVDSNESENNSEASDISSQQEAAVTAPQVVETRVKPRKRKRSGDEDDLEQAYFKRLQREEDRETKQKERERQADQATPSTEDSEDTDLNSDLEDASSTASTTSSISEPSSLEVPLKHEIFSEKLTNADKLNRTIFLGNVSTEVIKTKAAKRTLCRHLRSVLKTPAHGKRPGKFESIRFRSTAYTSGSGPKKATYAKKELMDATSTNTNAYAVFTTETAAEHVARTLNGSVVLDRHLRVDSLARPTPVDHKRCVFIGNLSFVNEETAPPGNDGETPAAPRRNPLPTPRKASGAHSANAAPSSPCASSATKKPASAKASRTCNSRTKMPWKPPC